jgi:hypothetical protein
VRFVDSEADGPSRSYASCKYEPQMTLLTRALRTSALFAPLAVLGLCLGACGGPEPGVGQRAQPIVNGTPTDLFPQVGALLASGVSACTATLIGSRTVLTAAHCVAGRASISFHPAGDSGPSYRVAHVAIHPSYNGGNVADLALLTLEGALPGVKPLPLAERPVSIGEQIRLLGFGRTAEVDGEPFGTKRMAYNQVARLEPQIFRVFGADGLWGNICDGDSGGPSLAEREGELRLVGVHSTKSGACGVEGADMRVDAFLTWIVQNAASDVTLPSGRDPVPPQVGIVTPQPGQTLRADFTVLANATDDRQIARVEVHVDGQLVGVRRQPPFRVDVRGQPMGPVAIEVRAFDDAGNSAKATVLATVTMPAVAPSPGSPPCGSATPCAEAAGCQLIGAGAPGQRSLSLALLALLALLVYRRQRG